MGYCRSCGVQGTGDGLCYGCSNVQHGVEVSNMLLNVAENQWNARNWTGRSTTTLPPPSGGEWELRSANCHWSFVYCCGYLIMLGVALTMLLIVLSVTYTLDLTLLGVITSGVVYVPFSLVLGLGFLFWWKRTKKANGIPSGNEDFWCSGGEYNFYQSVREKECYFFPKIAPYRVDGVYTSIRFWLCFLLVGGIMVVSILDYFYFSYLVVSGEGLSSVTGGNPINLYN